MKKYSKDNLNKVLVVVIAVLSAIMYASYIFPDILVTTRNGMVMWDAIFSGKFRSFYLMNENVTICNNYGTNGSAVYDFPIYLVFAIWNLPLWIYEKITGCFALDRYVGLMWAKSITIPFMIGIFVFVNKICKLVCDNQEREDNKLLIFMSSVYFVVPILVMGQYDAIGLFLLLLSIYHYIQNNEIKFVIFSAIAATFKMFALFVFVPLVLLKSKKMKDIMLKLFGGTSLLLLCKILQKTFFYESVVASEYKSGHFLDFVMINKVSLVYCEASIFFIVYVIFCLYCLLIKKPEEELGKWAIYISFVGFALFFVSSLTHPQWSLMLLPFVILIITMYDEKSETVGLLIDTITNLGIFVSQLFYYYYVFSVGTSKNTLAGKLFFKEGMKTSYSIADAITDKITTIPESFYVYAGNGIFVAGILFLIYWSNPKTNREKFNNIEISSKTIIVIRMIAMAVLMFMFTKVFTY